MEGRKDKLLEGIAVNGGFTVLSLPAVRREVPYAEIVCCPYVYDDAVGLRTPRVNSQKVEITGRSGAQRMACEACDWEPQRLNELLVAAASLSVAGACSRA